MTRYELHINGQIIKGSADSLKDFVRNVKDPYVIYSFEESKMHEVDLRISKNRDPKEKLTEKEKENAIRLNEKGYSKKLIAKKYRVSVDYLTEHVNFPKLIVKNK